MATVPQTDGVYAGERYKVSGTAGTLTYNAVSYTDGQIVLGVDGVNDYTATGDFVLNYMVYLKQILLEVTPNLSDLVYPGRIELKGVSLEFLESSPIFTIDEFTDKYRLTKIYSNGVLTSPVSTYGGTLGGVVTNLNQTGIKTYLTLIKANSPSGKSLIQDTEGTTDRDVKWFHAIADAGVIPSADHLLRIEILVETAAQLKLRIVSNEFTSLDITVESYSETAIAVSPSGSSIVRTINDTFDSSSVLRVTGYRGSDNEYIEFNLVI
jgi:hypothetical protein